MGINWTESSSYIKLGRICGLVLLLSFTLGPQQRTKVWLIGDSTMADKEVKAYPETGWGMPFANFFDSTVVVDNRARNGRSTKSFIAEGLWQPVVDQLKEGDYVLIQFGHNDEFKEKTGRYTTIDVFKANLLRYVEDASRKGAIPVLLTPVARRSFDSTGQVRETHPLYADAVREVARQHHVPLIDLDEKSKELLQVLGPVTSKLLFNYLDPGEHPNYPEGHKDDTHFNELGARKMAEIVLDGIRGLRLGLAEHIRLPLTSARTVGAPIGSDGKPAGALVVAQEGKADYRTVQAALDAIPLHNSTPVTIFIRKGLYHEKLHLAPTKDHVSLVGEEVSGVILSYDDHPGMVSPQGDSINTRTSHSFLVQGNDLSIRNITIRNDAGYTAGQAVALEVQGDRATFIDCRIIGNQDVLFLNSETSRQYYLRCYIEGTTDFIFGPATAWFDHCTIYSKKNSHVTAASTPEGHAYGFVFNACQLTGDTVLHNVSLGRPWRPYASVIYMYCHIGGHIRPEGWANWNNTDNYKTARFAEYKNEGAGASAPKPGGTLGAVRLDAEGIARTDAKVASRVSWAKELTDEEARRITLKNIFGDWLPDDKQPASLTP